jgi:serine/threonine protein kinase
MKPKGVVASHETYSFSAVEHLHGNISTASDVWSLGLNLKRWLDGLDVKDLPLDNGDLSQLRKPLFPTEPRTALDHLVWEMTKTNPEDRVSIDDAIARVKSMNDIHDPVEEDKGKGRARPRTEVRSNILKGLGQ